MPQTPPSPPSATAGQQPTATRLRHQLLEFLKFRVLASQEAFFAEWRLETGPAPTALPASPVDPVATEIGWDLAGFRAWLLPLWPAAAALSERDLRLCLEQAMALYLDPPPAVRR